MKIGVNLVGVSYNEKGRYRNYEDAIDSFYKYIVWPLEEEGHNIFFYLYTYQNQKSQKIVEDYIPCVKAQFINKEFNSMGGGDNLHGYKVMSVSYIKSLEALKDEELDLVISTRFDIKFFKNPFTTYSYDFGKFNFLWREPEYKELPLVNDTFVVFPYSMLDTVIQSIHTMETKPSKGVNIAMHNWYLPLIDKLGIDKVQWVDDHFKTAISNDLYQLTRIE